MRAEVKHQDGFGKFLKMFCFLTLFFFISVVCFAFNDEDGYFFLINTVRTSGGSTLSNLIQTVTKDENESNSSKSKSTGKSSSSGVNLNLIDRINANTAKKGYIKEILELCRDAQGGEIASGAVPVECILGIWENEVGYDNEGLPDFYFKPSKWKKDSKDYSIAGFTSKSKITNGSNNLDGSAGYGMNQNSNLKLTTKAKRNPTNNSRGYSSGDARYVPDCIASIYSRASSVLSKVKKASYTTRSYVMGVTNNRGSINQQLAGVAYNTHGNSSYYDWDKMSSSVCVKLANEVGDAYDNYVTDNKAAKDVSQDYCAAVAIMIGSSSNSNRWFINSTAYNFLLRQGYVSVYKSLYGNKKSDNAIRSELSAHKASSLAASIKAVNGSFSGDTKSIYGTSSDYQDCSYYSESSTARSYGYVWFVSDIKDTKGFYKHGSNPYHVIAFDGISFRYTYDTSIYGEYCYAYLLKEAGVDSVDPTNVKTYMNQYYVESSDGKTDSSGTWTASGALKTTYSASKVLKNPKLVDIDSLSTERAKVVNQAIQMAGSKDFVYDWGGRSTDVKSYYARKLSSYGAVSDHSYSRASAWYRALKYPKYGVDCSGFIYACYNLAGIKTEYAACRGGLKNGTSYWKKIDRSQLQPGDILVSDTHVVMYMGSKNGLIQTIESKQSGTYVGCYYESSHPGKQALRHVALKGK